MKSRIKMAIPMAAALALGVAGQAGAADFFDFVAADITTAAGLSTVSTTMNSSDITATWSDTNSDGIFDPTELLSAPLRIYDRKGNLILQSGPADNTRALLGDWAQLHADEILSALFPAGFSEITGATDDAMMASATASRNLFRKAGGLRKGAGKGKGKGTAAQNKGETPEQEEEKTQEVRAEVEYLDLKVAENSGNAYSMIMGYANESDSGLEFSLSVPYRYSTMKDDVESKSHFIGLDLSVKYPLKKWDNSEWSLGGDLFGSAYYLKTRTIDNAGNLKYGGGAFTSVNTDLGFATLGVGVDYKIAKSYLPSSMTGDNIFLDKAIEYINNLDPVHTISYGFNLGVPLANDTAAINLEVIRASFVSGDVPDGQENRTTVGLSGAYFPSDTFEINLGVRSDFELEDVDSFGVMLGVVHKF